MLELDDLFVDPDAMRTGVARQLILRIATEAEREDVARIDVTANMHAPGFYDAVGFVVGPRVDTEFGAGRRMHLEVARFLRAQAPPTRPEHGSRARLGPGAPSSGSLRRTAPRQTAAPVTLLSRSWIGDLEVALPGGPVIARQLLDTLDRVVAAAEGAGGSLANPGTSFQNRRTSAVRSTANTRCAPRTSK